jgi:hypothetical protein
MPTLTIDLQDGFQDEPIRIELNGRKVVEEAGINTRFQIGFAASHKVDVEYGIQRISIALPKRQIVEPLELNVSGPLYLGVSLNPAGALICRIQEEPFGYL